MSWNYRVVHRHLVHPNGGEDVYAVHEVYYDDDGNPTMVTENPVYLAAESVKELNADRILMGAACRKPVLEWDDIVRPKKPAR
jgi:hypothetical protein